MKKMLVSIILCMIMAFNLMGVSAYEYIPYVGDGVISATPVTVKFDKVSVNGGVEEVTEAVNIADATRVTASCMVKPGSAYDEEVKVMMIIAGYKGRRLVSYNSSETTTFSSATDSVKKVSAVLEKGEQDIDGVKVFLWDSVDNARPLFNHGNFGAAGNTIEGILIGGQLVEIDEDTKTGSVEVNAGYVEWPDIVVLTDDITTEVSVDVKGCFPLSKQDNGFVKSNIEVNGTSETGIVTVKVADEIYTVNVTQAIPQIKDVKFRVFSANIATETEPTYYTDNQIGIYYGVVNPTWTDEIPGPNKEATDGDNLLKYDNGLSTLEKLTPAYSDKTQSSGDTWALFNMAPELLGSQFICAPWISASNNNGTVDDCFTFTIDRSARIYYFGGDVTLDSSWVRARNEQYASTVSLNTRMYYEFRVSATGNSVQTATGDRLYYKDYNVTPGETCQISLPAGKTAPKVFVKYQDSEFVTNASYTVDGTETSAEVTDLNQPLYKDAAATVNPYQIYTNPSSSLNTNHPYAGGGNLMFSTVCFTESNRFQYSLVRVPEELNGTSLVTMPFTLTGCTKVDFDISSSARVYVFTNAGNQTGSNTVDSLKEALGEGWVNTDFEYGIADLDDKDIAIGFRIGNMTINETVKNNSSFYCDYIVQPDDSGHVTINLPSIKASTRVIVAIKPLSE